MFAHQAGQLFFERGGRFATGNAIEVSEVSTFAFVIDYLGTQKTGRLLQGAPVEGIHQQLGALGLAADMAHKMGGLLGRVIEGEISEIDRFGPGNIVALGTQDLSEDFFEIVVCEITAELESLEKGKVDEAGNLDLVVGIAELEIEKCSEQPYTLFEGLFRGLPVEVPIFGLEPVEK